MILLKVYVCLFNKGDQSKKLVFAAVQRNVWGY